MSETQPQTETKTPSLYQSISEVRAPSLNLLLKGPSGAGKTTKACYFPAPALISFDKNNRSLLKLPKEVASAVRLVDPRIDMKTGKQLQEHQVWSNFLDVLNAIMEDSEIGTIIVDSLTSMSGVLQSHLQNTSSPNAQMTMPQWYSFQRYLDHLLTELTAKQDEKHVIVTAHEELVKDDVTGRTMFQLLLSTKFRSQIDIYFSDVWRCYTEQEKGQVKYMVSTQPDMQVQQSKTSLELPAKFWWDGYKDKVLEQVRSREVSKDG